MTHLFSRRAFLLMFCCIWLVCAFPLLAQDTPTPAPVDEPTSIPEKTSEPVQMLFGSGPFTLSSPTHGLADLTSYRATLILSFEGTRGGQPEHWSHTYVMLATQTPAVHQLTIDTADDPASQVFKLQTIDTIYERTAGTTCVASGIEQDGAQTGILEPAGLLDSVIGADEAGTENINGVDANHYTFDERAHGAAGIAKSIGEIWVAAEGDYLVRYKLENTGGVEYFGGDLEGKLTWLYDLTDVNQPLVINLPADCGIGIVNVPVLPDAVDVLRASGLTTYTTTTNLADATAFYQEQFLALGAKSSFEPALTDTSALLEFTQGDQLTSVIIATQDGITTVIVAVVSTAPPTVSNVNQGTVPNTNQAGTQNSGVCSVSTATGANQRGGPGTNFALVGKLAAGTIAPVIGQATSSDGKVWWQVSESAWVRSDVVIQVGNCDSVPVVK
ncbi:MAG: hypothetical protein H0X30_07750 [Anaerolineae bacterium]|nr:hypothetical protein [Anaerolineae bacterium]